MVVFGNKTVYMLNYDLLNRKRHILAWNHVVWLLCMKINSAVLAVERWKNPKESSRVNIFDVQFCAYVEIETP